MNQFQSQPSAPPVDMTRFELFIKQKELNPVVANQLRDILSMCEIVLLCDDSDSMANPIAEEGTDPFAPKRSTRWLELKKLVSVIIDFVTAVNPNGLDIYFLNRDKKCAVQSISGLQSIFSVPPNGGTPLIAMINQIYSDKINLLNGKKLLIVVVTDGEPTDGNRDDLYNTIKHVTRHGSVHVSFAECTDNAEDMEYLDMWDGCIQNFDNTDDYREELQRIKTIQGNQFKFDYTDYVIKILLATFVRWYFNLDQTKVVDSRKNNNSQIPSYQNYQVPQPQFDQPPLTYTQPPPLYMQPPVQYVQPQMQSQIQPPSYQNAISNQQPTLNYNNKTNEIGGPSGKRNDGCKCIII
jgi:hypothetical protein